MTFLVEHYRPGGTPELLRRHAGRIRTAVCELNEQGQPVRLLSSVIVPGDEALLCVLEGPSERLVHETYARAEVSVERISVALSDPPARHGKPDKTRLELESGKERP